MTDQQLHDSSSPASSVGQTLRDARIASGLSHRDLAATTRIPAHLLECLEANRFDEFPAEVFARGFLRNYARELRLDDNHVLDLYRSQRGLKIAVSAAATTATAVAKREAALAEPSRATRMLYAAALALLVLGLAGSVLIFGGDDALPAPTATYAPADGNDAWRPAPDGQDDWRTIREN